MSAGNQLPNLEKLFRDEDELDFQPSGGSNLAAIFGIQTKVQDTQPFSKPPTHKKSGSVRNPPQAVVPNKLEVIIAKVVHAFKLHNGSYVSVGNLGMALIGTALTRTYQIILYKTKQEHVSVVTITHDFLYIVQANNYSSYYDSNKDNWSILFENNEVCIEFAREIGLARYFAKESRTENIIYQDLTPTSKDVIAKEGDNVSMKYYIATEIVQPFKSSSTAVQTMTVEISTDNNWERVLLGANKGLKRVLFLPPGKQISLGPGFPKEKDIMLEIEIMEIKTPEESPQIPKIGTSGKAAIISRMAKMGQSMLPKLPTSTTTDSEDTEDDVFNKSPHQKKTEPLGTALQKKNLLQESGDDTPRHTHKALKSRNESVTAESGLIKPLVSTSAFTSQWAPTQMQQNYVTLDGQVYSLQPQNVTPTVPTVMDPSLNILLSENRMMNTELRMGMSKIADNVQKLLDKFHVLELQNATTPTTDRLAMDATLKMLLTMNSNQSSLKDDELQKGADFTNSNINDNMTELNDMRAKMAMLENELKESKESLKNSTQRIRSLESEKTSLIQTNENLSKKIQEMDISLKDANDMLKKTRGDLEESKNLSNHRENKNTELEDRISELLAERATLENPSNSIDEKDSDAKNKEIKRIMNKTYQTLLEKFVEESYSTDYIRSTIASTIKSVTLHILYDKSNEEEETAKLVETDATKIDNLPTKTTVNNIVPDTIQQVESSKNNMTNIIPAIQDEPPPIPPIDAEVDSDWLQ